MVQESELERGDADQLPNAVVVSSIQLEDSSPIDNIKKDDESEDDEPIVRTKPKKINRSILDDSDDEIMEVMSPREEKRGEDEEVEEEEVEEEEAIGKRRVKRIQDSSDEEEEKKDAPGSPLTSSDATDVAHTQPASSVVPPTTSLAANSDLFDAEMDDDEGSRLSSESEGNPSEGENDDAGPEMSEALRKRLAKGAAKKAPSKRKAAVQSMEATKMKIHSETQRLVREASVRLPYHEPAKMDLAAVLAKTRKKQEQLGEKTRLLWKEVPKEEEEEEAPVVDMTTEQDEGNKESIGGSISEYTEETPAAVNTINEDELPDLIIETVPKKENEEITLYIGQETEQDSVKPSSSTSPLKRVGLTPKLAALKVDSFTPKLGKGHADFIDLDSDEENPGMDDLLSRLVKHNKTIQKKAKDVSISTISKEKSEGDEKEELKLKSFTYHVEADKDGAKPGVQLQNLKQQLKAKMRVQKRISREERLRLYDLENEEGFEGTRMEEDPLDLEAELTDPSDSESSGDEEEEEDYIDEEEYGADQPEPENNPFLEMEADDDDDDEDERGSLHLHLDSDSQQADDADSMSFPPKVKFDIFDEDANTDSPTISQKSNLSDLPDVIDRPFINLSGEVKEIDNDQSQQTNTSILSPPGSTDDLNTLSPAKQHQITQNALTRGTTPELFTPSTKGSMSKFGSDLALPMDDSQELLSCSSLPAAQSTTRTQVEQTPVISTQESFRFDFEDLSTQTQVLDEDGLLKVKSSQSKIKSKSRRQLLESSIQGESVEGIADDDAPWAICSGRFTQDTCSSSGPPLSQNLDQVPEGTQGEMSQLLGVLSGKFVEEKDDTVDEDPDSPIKIKRTKNRRAIFNDDESNESFCLDDQSKVDEEGDEPEELDSDEENKPPSKFAGFLSGPKQGKLRQEFVEDEAELSGSEYDSDENFDIPEEDDVLELQDGDMDDVGSHKALHDQVNRLHMRSLIDSDKREIRLLQEMYLPDGDMHSEGQGRMRRFRWANIDDDGTQQDMFRDSDGEEKEEEEEEAESKWRMERIEREKFLAEQKAAEGDKDEEDVSVLKLGKVVYKAPPSSKVSKQPEASTSEQVTKPTRATGKPANLFKIPRTGSFLSKGKDTLAKIAEMSKPVSEKIGGPKHSRSFVFSAQSQGANGENSQEKRSKPQVKRSTSVTSEVPNPKRPKLERSNTMPVKSVFDHI